MRSRAPVRRLGNPAELPQTSVWLVSDTGGYGTGPRFVDGGVTVT
jgi:hypothetical protein